MKNTAIRWTDHTWNPISGCHKISEGCDNCYAEALATGRFSNAFPKGFAPHWKPHKLREPARVKDPSRFFVNSMSDLFLADWTDEQIFSALDVMREISRHDYLVLTKRPERMRQAVDRWLLRDGLSVVPENIWFGVSVESQKWAERRIPILLDVPAQIRFLSCEPLLGPVDLAAWLPGLSWVIVGGESGNGTKNYRAMDLDWARAIRDSCVVAGIPFFFKQSSASRTEVGIELDGMRWEEFPRAHPSARSNG